MDARIRTAFRFVQLACGATVAVALLTPSVEAMPNFARQYGISCSSCHSVIPRLNEAGYEFRRAGFRMPDEIGKPRDVEKNRETASFIGANYFDARIQANASYLRRDHATDTGDYTAIGDNKYTNSQIELLEFTLYPLTGAFLKNWSTLTEISGSTDEIEVENAYVRYDVGNETNFYEFRGGVFHPFEGYGASDRPIGLSRPLIQTTATTNAVGDANGWTPWGFDESGVEGGFNLHKSSLSLAVFNGLIENADDPAQGGKLKKAAGSPTQNKKDLQLFFNQFFGKSEMAVSAYYYNGRISLGPATLYQNDFDRWAVYVTVPIKKLLLLGAYSQGSDKEVVTNLKTDNKGWFFEADGYLSEKLGLGARYDQFDPSDVIDANSVKAITAFVNSPLQNGLQFIAELKNKKTEHGPGNPDQTDNSLNIRAIYIW